MRSSLKNASSAAIPCRMRPAAPEYLQIAITAFTTVFFAELGDKTQLATLTISAGSGSPLVVFLGAAIALVLTSFLGVAAGKWLSKNVSPQLLNTLTGLSFLFLAVSLTWDAVR